MSESFPQPVDSYRQSGKHRHFTRWRCLVFAAGVALRQLGPASVREERQAPPYVLLLPGEPPGLSVREIAGGTILTESLDLAAPHQARRTDNPN